MERTYRVIFGSQLVAIEHMRTVGGQALSEQLKSAYYDPAAARFPQMYANYSFEQWLGYLTSSGVIEVDGETAKLTPQGVALIPYLALMGYPLQRIG